jgi:type VI secretion system protein ImpF
MIETTRGTRLQPSLLDRLTDEHPQRRSEPLESRVMSGEGLRASVLRELRWLFNAAGQPRDIDAGRHPYASASVLNYGLPNFVGSFAVSVDVPRLHAAIRQAIVRFEPRILPSSIEIEPASGEQADASLKQIALVIRALLSFQPAPLAIVLHTQVDLEDGSVTVNEAGV